MNNNYIIFNGYNSSNIGLIEELPIPNRAERDIEFVEIEGRNGYLTFDRKSYKPIDYEVTIITKAENIDFIKHFFNGSGELVLSHDVNRYYKATVIGSILFSRQVKDVYEVDITFKLQPFSYDIVKNVITLENGSTIENETNTTAQPTIKVYGNGNGSITINGNRINLNNLEKGFILNFEYKEAYGFDGKFRNSDVSGEYNDLQVGINMIEFTENITKIEITPNWRYL